MQRRGLAWGFAVLMPLWAAQAHAEAGGESRKAPPETTETSGLALGVQLPTGAGLIGVRADYLFQIPRTLFRFGGFAGIGALLCVEPSCHASGIFGVRGSWGHRHRVFLEVLGGTLGGVSLMLHGQYVASRAVWGVASEIGYEYMSESGMFVSFAAGISVLVEPAIERLSDTLGPELTLVHVGYKLW